MGPVRGTYGPVRAPPSRVDPPPYGGREAKSDPTREGSACVGIVRPPPCGGGGQFLALPSRVCPPPTGGGTQTREGSDLCEALSRTRLAP